MKHINNFHSGCFLWSPFAHIGNDALKEMKRQLNTEPASLPLLQKDEGKVWGFTHVLPKHLCPQKPDLRTFRALLSPQDYYSSNSGNSTSLEASTWRYGAQGHSSCYFGLEQGAGDAGPSPRGRDKGWGRTRAFSCLCGRLNPSFQASQKLGTGPDIYVTVLQNVLVLIRSS